MKEIKAYIKPHKLSEVTMALQKIKRLRGMSVTGIKGFGRRDEEEDSVHPVVDDLMDFAPYVKIEIFCHDDLVDLLVSVIEEKAYTGLRGDGKIYVSSVDKAFKIGSGEIR
ncbi:MAG: P-II family nitrogen regulator [Nitrospirae bacterium]|nr:P-II family nitrogen regulator [Nitrospirota bacterium]